MARRCCHKPAQSKSQSDTQRPNRWHVRHCRRHVISCTVRLRRQVFYFRHRILSRFGSLAAVDGAEIERKQPFLKGNLRSCVRTPSHARKFVAVKTLGAPKNVNLILRVKTLNSPNGGGPHITPRLLGRISRFLYLGWYCTETRCRHAVFDMSQKPWRTAQHAQWLVWGPHAPCFL